MTNALNLLREWTGEDLVTTKDLTEAIKRFDHAVLLDMGREKYGSDSLLDIVSRIREWDREDVSDLKAILEVAGDHQAINGDDFREIRREMLREHSTGTINQYLRDGYGGDSLIAVDSSESGLIAKNGGENEKNESHDINEPILPLSFHEHLDRASALIQDNNIPKRYDNLADVLRLIAELVEDESITNLDELEQVLMIIRDVHDLLYERVLYDLVNLETLELET